MTNEPIPPQEFLSLVTQLELLLHDKNNINEQIAELLKEAKENGIKIPILKKVLSARKTPEKKQKEEEMLDLYLEMLQTAERQLKEGS